MIVQDVMEEIGAKLDTIVGLRVFPYWADGVPAPAAVVGLPDEVQFDQTYGRGLDAMTVPVWVLVSPISDRAACAELAAYLNGAGAKSVKAKVDSTPSNTYTECDTVTVSTAETGSYLFGGETYFGAEFTVSVTGSGS